MNRLVRSLAAPVLAAAVTLSAGVVAAGPASALACRDCGGSGDVPVPGPITTPPPAPAPQPIAKSGVGGDGNSYAWQGLNAPTDRFITVHTHTNPIDGHTAWWMDDTATVDRQTGLVTLSGTIEDDNWFGGYTGGVHVIGTDDYGNLLAQTSVNAAGVVDDPAWGVCGTWELVCSSSRSLGASLQMTGDFKDVTHLVVLNWHDGKNRLLDDLNYIASVFGAGKNAFTGITAILGALAG